MRFVFLLSSAVGLAASISVPGPPQITSGPNSQLKDETNELRRRQQDVSYLTEAGISSYIAQFPWPDASTGPTWHTATCESNDYFAARGGYAACCNPPANNCQFATACAGSIVLGANGASSPCEEKLTSCGPTGWTCQDVLIYNSRGSSDTNTYFVCNEGAYTSRSTWYRNRFEFPSTTTSTTVEGVTSTATTTSVTMATATETVAADLGSNQRKIQQPLVLAAALLAMA